MQVIQHRTTFPEVQYWLMKCRCGCQFILVEDEFWREKVRKGDACYNCPECGCKCISHVHGEKIPLETAKELIAKSTEEV